jgi:outer membrane lipoprotein-sorting protein
MASACQAIALAALLAQPLPAATAAASAAASSASADFATVVRQRLHVSAVLKGEFDQSKTLKGFRNPLVSHGEFLVARGQGVWWHTQQPFESTLVVTKSRLFTRAADGSANNVMDAQTEPGLKQVNELVFSLLSADLEALADKFTVAARPVGADGWTLTLTPRDPNLAKFLVRATLTGDRFVQTVRIDEARGDTTQIRFSHQAPSAALAADDAARFQ